MNYIAMAHFLLKCQPDFRMETPSISAVLTQRDSTAGCSEFIQLPSQPHCLCSPWPYLTWRTEPTYVYLSGNVEGCASHFMHQLPQYLNRNL